MKNTRRKSLSRGVRLVLWGGLLLLTVAAQAQDARLTAALADGVRAFEAGQHAQAVAHLLPVFEADPAFARPDVGAAAYWLGSAYQSANEPQNALAVWERGWSAAAAQGRVDLRLADALVRNVYQLRDTARHAVSATAYLALLEHLDGPLPIETQALRARHLAPLALILPDDVRRETGLTQDAGAGQKDLPAGAGARLTAWWRSMDTLPATPVNERVIEHLERVAYAGEHFADAAAASGLDDRGRVYIRLGPPSHTTPVQINQFRTASEGLSDPLGPFYPQGALWVYRHVDDSAHYLFVKEAGKPYRLGQPTDLVPVSLRTKRTSLRLLEAMEGIYRMMALYHPDGHYGSYYEQIASYRGLLSDVAYGRQDPDPPGVVIYKVQPPPPGATTQTLLSHARSDDRRAVRQRDAQVPPFYSNLFDGLESLPVAVRWARFLDEDGTTRTELYWGLQVRELHPSNSLRRRLRQEGHEPSGSYLLNLTVAQQSADYRTRAVHREHHLVEAPPHEAEAVIPAQAFVARGDTGRYHLALQWDAFWAYGTPLGQGDLTGVEPGPLIRLGSYRVDTLTALRNDPARLEMSDLKPLRISARAPLPEDAPPYPNAAVTPQTQLGLYFEVYHLTFGPDDQTHFTVAYEVARREQPGGLLEKAPIRRTTAQTRYSGDSRSAHETILLGLDDLEGTGQFEITVRVTDEITGQQTQRALSFDVRE